MRRAAWLLLTAACASAPPAPTPSLVRVPQEPLRGEPQRAGDPPGVFPLPSALAVDPRKIPIPALALQVVKSEQTALSNGVPVYLIEDHAVPLVTIRALVAVGSVDDPPNKLGLADLVLDLLDSAGAGGLSADALDQLLEGRAANAGGSAGEEHSFFSLNFRSEDADALLPVFADMLLRPRFEASRVTVAVNQYLESVRRRPDNPDALAARAVRKAVFGPSSLLGREPTEKTLKSLRPEDLRAFHRSGVVPGTTRLMVTGDFQRGPMLAKLESLFGQWKGPAPKARDFGAPPTLQRRVLLVPKDTPQAKIRIGGTGFPRLSPQEYAARLANTALGSFGVGRMYREIRGGKGLAYSAYSVVSPGPTRGMFLAGADTQPAKAAQAIEEMLRLIDELKGRRPVTSEELAVSVDMYLNSFAFRFDAPEKVVRERAVFDLYGYPADYLDRYRERIAAVDVAAVQAAVSELARLDELQIVVVGPPAQLGDLSRFGTVVQISDVETFR